jgi:hypothetical protein
MGRDFQKRALLRLAEGKQEVSNSLAVDEEGGLFVITDSSLYRIQWDAAAEPPLSVTWSVRYESDGTRHVGRLGKGSGTTPTLVGVGEQQDKLVAICDDRRLMRLVLYWRNEIPADWPGLPGKDRRVAAELPVRFGNADASRSTTEQSLVVRGYGIAVVSNRYGSFGPLAQWYIRRRLGEDLHAATIYKSNEPHIAPRGIEKLVWDPARRTLNTAWVNRTVSCPNGIPVMSDSSGLLYFIGQRDAQWTLEALDWQTGRSTFHRRLSSQPRYNSFFAGMLIGPGGSIFSGTYGGVLRFTP